MKIISEKEIYNNMKNTYLSLLPYELLEMILDISSFKNHNILQYKVNQEIRSYYSYHHYNNLFHSRYVYDETHDLLLMEINFNN
jgi:hypothetical protein